MSLSELAVGTPWEARLCSTWGHIVVRCVTDVNEMTQLFWYCQVNSNGWPSTRYRTKERCSLNSWFVDYEYEKKGILGMMTSSVTNPWSELTTGCRDGIQRVTLGSRWMTMGQWCWSILSIHSITWLCYWGNLNSCRYVTLSPRDLANITAVCALTGMVTDWVGVVGIMNCELVLTKIADQSDGDMSWSNMALGSAWCCRSLLSTICNAASEIP